MSGLCDFHSHLIPGVDDGAADEAESEAGLVALESEGVTALVTTPHVSAWLTQRAGLDDWLHAVDRGWARFEAVAARHAGTRVMRGAEIALDSPDLDASDPRLRLNGGKFVLVEFAGMTVPPYSDRVLRRLRDGGVVPVLAHPERYDGIRNDADLPGRWRDGGALLQVNAGSVMGRYGTAARDAAIELLRRGAADFICSDYHARGQPSLAACRRELVAGGAADQADLLMSINPGRLIDGEFPLPVPPVTQTQGHRGLLRRLFGR